jgi:hypothetical protein
VTILAMRTAIVTRLREAFPLLATHIHSHFRTKLDSKDIHACLDNTHLAMRVAFVGNPDQDASITSGMLDMPGRWVLYLIAKDRTGKKADGGMAAMRDETLLEILPEVLRVIASDGFTLVETTTQGETETYKPKGVRSAPVYEGDPESSTSSALVWGVRFGLEMLIPPADDEDIRAFTALVTHYDLTPPEDPADYEGHDEDDFEATDNIDLPQDP